jgi:prepilin signal peptidase PulO-like enzyme (type II secretory pathway)
MAMIGAFFGWQVVWIAFFLAPFFGLAFVLIAWLVTGDNATPFGPYLCAATLYAMINWASLWGASSLLFLPPLLILPILLGLLLMLGAMLWGIQTVKMLLFGSK